CLVGICAREAEALETAVAALRDLGSNAFGIQADCTRTEDIQRVIAAVSTRWGDLDILVNNVGGEAAAMADFERAGDPVWSEVYDRNAFAAIRFTRGFVPLMRKRGWGRVVTISSIRGREGGGRPWYNMAKAAEISLMKTLAMDRDLVRSGITFNSI